MCVGRNQVLEADSDLLAPLIVSCAGWIEEHDTQTGLVRFDRNYDEPPPWLPIEALKALATGVFADDHALDDSEILEALLIRELQKLDRRHYARATLRHRYPIQ